VKAVLSWILVAIFAVAALVGHGQYETFKEREEAGKSYALGCRRDSPIQNDDMCTESKRRIDEKVKQRSYLYVYLPISALAIALIFALASSVRFRQEESTDECRSNSSVDATGQ
jgi:TRAP-type C4-dicarboxylate transport system permease small subunit